MEAGGGLRSGSTRKVDSCSDEVVKTIGTMVPFEARNDVERVESETQVVPGVIPIAPITPIPVKEVREVRAVRPVVQCCLAKIDVDNSEETECGSPCTPKQGVFDPFAPGSDGMCLAPKIKTKTGESRVSVARQLHFDLSTLGESSGTLRKMSSDDEKLMESVCDDILDVIVPSSTERGEAEKVEKDADTDGFKTPPLVPCFNRIGNKCPDAPMKQGRTASKRLHIDPSLCRKLEF